MLTNLQAVGMIEFNSIAAGIESADAMLKAANVEPLFLKTVCPGKFVSAVHGSVAAVESSVEAGMADCAGSITDHFVLANISPGVVTALSCPGARVQHTALGIIETFTAASCIVAADTAMKSADVELMDIRMALGLGGKAFNLLCGDVSAVEQAVAAGARKAAQGGLLVNKVVIANAAQELLEQLM